MNRMRARSGIGMVGLMVIVAVMVGCGASTSAGSLADTEWELTEIHGRDALDDASVTIRFGTDDELSGSGGCNRYHGTWETDARDELTLLAEEMTLMACDQQVMDQEQAFMAALAATTTFDRRDSVLRLFDAEGTRVLEFETIRRAQLTGTRWEAQAIADDQQNATSLLDGTTITALFENLDDRLSGSAGCNTYTATFSRDAGSISIESVAVTTMNCDDPVVEQETRFLQALERAARYQPGRETLDLLAEDGSLLISFREAD